MVLGIFSKRHPQLFLVPLLFLFFSSHAAYYYSGTVQNKTAQGIADANVALIGTSATARSNASGYFVISGNYMVAVRSQPAAAFTSRRVLEIRNNGILLSGLEKTSTYCVLYDLAGRKLCDFNAKPRQNVFFRPSFSGCIIARLQSGGYGTAIKLFCFENRLQRGPDVFVTGRAADRITGKAFANDPGSPMQYLCATKTGYYQGTAWTSQDTMTGIIITLLDTASYQTGPAYLNPSLPYAVRVWDLIQRLTLDEKASLMNNASAAVSRLSIPAYNWWNEALHGVARSGLATSFPIPTGLAATFDTAAIFSMTSIISTEGRAKYHDYLAKGQGGNGYGGITFWSPLVDISHDPRWGRVLETYGEDPFLTGKIADAFIRGMQGSDPRYLKTSATAKHFAAHSGPDVGRSTFNAVVTIRDLQDTYFPTFISAIRQSGVEAIMCAYIRVNGVYSCSNKWLLDTMIRQTWGFKGHVVSDCGATALVQSGCDIGCGTFTNIASLVRGGSLSEALVDTALSRTLLTRFKLGMFDPPQMVPFSSIPVSIVNCQKHIDYARTMSRKSIVLLRNQNNVLPLAASVRTIALVGPNADPQGEVPQVMLGNYYGTPAKVVLAREGITARAAVSGVTVNYVRGCARTGTDYSGFAAAVTAAGNADAVVAVMGLASEADSPWQVFLEGETIDRNDLRLPAIQDSLLKRLVAVGKPVICVLINGGSLSIDYAAQNVRGILEMWYPGEQGGNAIADVLFGDYNPGGRLPQTYYQAATTFPAISVMSMTGRTYRYFTGQVLYPFGFGLSYTAFTYSNLRCTPSSGPTSQPVAVAVDVTNSGTRNGEEVVQVYVKDVSASVPVPIRSLAAFRRVAIPAGQTITVGFTLQPRNFSIVDNSGQRIVEPGDFSLSVGGGQPIAVDGSVPPLVSGTVTLTGSTYVITP